MSKKMFGSKIMLMAKQWPCKESKFDSIMAPRRSSWRNKWTVPFERARAGLFNAIFFSFGTALVIEKIGFENFTQIPTCHYIRRLLATTGLPAGIQILGIPTAKIQISNGRHTCYRYPPELKPSAKWPHGCPLLILSNKLTVLWHHWWQNWGKHEFWRFT